MWKGLKRLWSRKDAPERADEAPYAPMEPEPVVVEEPEPPDPWLQELHALDRLAAEEGAEAAVPVVRELLSQAPTDARVLRRAAVILRALGDEGLAQGFDQAAASSQAEPLVALASGFLQMDDPALALALADGALARESGYLSAVLTGAEALAWMGRHADALARLDALSFRSVSGDPRLAARWGLSAVAAGDLVRFDRIEALLPEGAGWITRAARRAAAFPAPVEAPPELMRQWHVFVLYGAVLLDDLGEGERLEPARLASWMHALAALCRATLDPETRPAWVSPRGEVLARWLGSLLPVRASLPLSARLPRQPVLVVLADDEDLATLHETRAWFDAPAPVFQALKDPGEIGSPMADVIGVFRAGVQLPLEGLEAERAADRVPPRMLATRLESDAGKVEQAALDGLLGWALARREDLSLTAPPPAEERLALTGDAPPPSGAAPI
ncbi:MAG: hypothetical protein IT385_04440 [Deltaproteobacteria bacterium]|nr:hypothetical protein [Deltaproteobacteria bacterium]